MLAVLALAGLTGAAVARAGDDWQKVGELTKGGKLPASRQASVCKLVCVEGVVIINTLVVFDGDSKQAIPVRAKLKKGEEREVPLGKSVKMTDIGMSISPDTKGRVAVYLK